LRAYAPGDRLLIERLSYRLREPRVGEAVVVRQPGADGRRAAAGRLDLKRIAAAPGSSVTVLGRPVVLGYHEWYVLGDNLSESTDSRALGPVKRRDITGRVWLQYRRPRDNRATDPFSKEPAVTQQPQPDVPPAPLPAVMLQGIHRAQAVCVAARLGIADLLAKGPLTVEALAEAAGARVPELNRLMRFLAGEGLFSHDTEGRYGLNEAAETLRSDAPNSVRPAALYLGSPHIWNAWSNLYASVTEGIVAFEATHGMLRWAYEQAHPEHYALFQKYQSAGAVRRSPAAYDYTGMQTVVDVGGGHGTILIDVLRANPGLRGVLFDVPDVIRAAEPMIAAAGLPDRCKLVAGSFFESVPPGGDAYILANILHDWNDADCLRILRSCRTAMHPGAKLIVAESIVPSEANTPSAVRYGDLQMMALTGGMKRTLEELATLFAQTGFVAARTIQFGANTIVEATAR
jgi:hypothetical protein